MPLSSSTHSEGSSRELREWLQHELDIRGWSNARLAREIGVFKSTVGRWLMDDDNPLQRRPSYESCRRLAALFGKDLRTVLEMAGIDDFADDDTTTTLQRNVMAMIPMIPDEILVVIEPMIKSLIGKRIQDLVREQMEEVAPEAAKAARNVTTKDAAGIGV